MSDPTPGTLRNILNNIYHPHLHPWDEHLTNALISFIPEAFQVYERGKTERFGSDRF
jgi:hypothetical protein